MQLLEAHPDRLGAVLVRCMLIGAITAGVPAAAAADTIQNFDSAGTSFALLGTAVELSGGPSGDFMRLVAANQFGSQGTIAFNQTDTGPLTNIVADFDFRMFLGSRADGIGFSLLNTAIFGSTGAVGTPPSCCSEEPNFAGSLGVGYDIWNNAGPSEPSNNHVSLHYNGVFLTAVDLYPLGIDLWSNASNPSFLHSQVIVDFLASSVSVSVGGTPVISNFLVPGLLTYDSRVWFGARTGGASANHDIDNIVVDYQTAQVQPVPEPMSVALVGSGLAALAWRRRKSSRTRTHIRAVTRETTK